MCPCEQGDDFSGLLGRLVRDLPSLDKDRKGCCGLTYQQCFVIETLVRTGPSTMNTLSSHLGVSVSTATRVVDILVRDGYLQRDNCCHDRRCVQVELTSKGSDVGARLTSCSNSYAQTLLNHIPEAEHASVTNALRQLIDAIEHTKGSCCRS